MFSVPLLSNICLRYLLMSLRANNDPSDAIDKARVVVDWLPEPWLAKSWQHNAKFGMLVKFLIQLEALLVVCHGMHCRRLPGLLRSWAVMRSMRSWEWNCDLNVKVWFDYLNVWLLHWFKDLIVNLIYVNFILATQ